MSSITIADRRAVMTASMTQSDFRELLRRDPHAGFQRATGNPAPRDARISVVEEQADVWEFVVPAGDIEAMLPEPGDARGVVENNVYDILRDEPGVRARAIQDPRAFFAERLHFDLGADVNVRVEQPGELVLVLPYGDSREELGDDALDLVAGGGQPPCEAAGPPTDANPEGKAP